MDTHKIVSFFSINESLMIILNPAILKLLLRCNNFEAERVLYTSIFSEYLASYSLSDFKINQGTSPMLGFFFFSFWLELILKHNHSLALTDITCKMKIDQWAWMGVGVQKR